MYVDILEQIIVAVAEICGFDHKIVTDAILELDTLEMLLQSMVMDEVYNSLAYYPEHKLFLVAYIAILNQIIAAVADNYGVVHRMGTETIDVMHG